MVGPACSLDSLRASDVTFAGGGWVIKQEMSDDAADVQRVMREYVPIAAVAVVVVGYRKTIEPRIAALNLGPIIGMTIDDVFAEP